MTILKKPTSDKQVYDMLKLRLIIPSTSPLSSAILSVNEKDGT